MTELLDILKGEKNSVFFSSTLPRGQWAGAKPLKVEEYTPRIPIMEQLQREVDMPFLKAQNADDEEFRKLVRELKMKHMFQKVKPSPTEDMTRNAPPVVAKSYEETYEAVSSSIDGMKWEPLLPTTNNHFRDKKPLAISMKYKLELQEVRKMLKTTESRKSNPVKFGTGRIYPKLPIRRN